MKLRGFFNERRVFIVLLVIILFASLFVRLHGVGDESVWLDEAISIHNAQYSLSETFSIPEAHPPLYRILLSVIVTLFGVDIFWIRLFSVLCGVLAVLVTALMGSDLFDKPIGLIAATLIAFSPYHIYFSQEARMYSLFVLLSLLSIYSFIVLYRAPENKKYWGLYILTTLLMIYTHLFGVFTVIAQSIFFMVFMLLKGKQRTVLHWVCGQFILLLLYIPVIVNTLQNSFQITRDFWREAFDPYLFELALSGGWPLNLLLRVFLIFGLYVFFSQWKKLSSSKREDFILLMVWSIVPIVLVVVLELFFRPIYVARYLLFLLIPYYLIVAYGMGKMHKVLVVLMVALIILLSLSYVYDLRTETVHEPWDDVSEHVRSIYLEGDRILVEPAYALRAFDYYYLPECFNENQIFNCSAAYDVRGIWGESSEEVWMNDSARIILVNRYREGSDIPMYHEFLSESYALRSKNEFKDRWGVVLTVTIFERDLPQNI